MVASSTLALTYCDDIARWILLTFGYGTFLYYFVSIMWITLYIFFILMPGFLLAYAACYDFSDDDDDEESDDDEDGYSK